MALPHTKETDMVVEGSLSRKVGVWSSGCVWIITDLGMLILNVQVRMPQHHDI